MWDDKERKGELESWLLSLTISRTGLFGPADTIFCSTQLLEALICLGLDGGRCRD